MTIDINTAMLLAIAFMNAIAAIAAWQTRKDAAEIKVHTNSMKDALVGAKEEVAALRAVEANRVQLEKDAAQRAKGALNAQMTAAVETIIKENGNHEPEPAKVLVMNTEKAIPVKIRKPAIAAKPKPRKKPRR